MKTTLLAITLLFSQMIWANEPPANYPLVKGLIRKIDLASQRLTVKHGDIPNLQMPGMTMSFAVSDAQWLQSLSVGDSILFVVDEVDSDYTILWLQKTPPKEVGTANILCTGEAPTTPKTNVEIEIRPERFSTIRYEVSEGSFKGTAQINSIGYLKPQHADDRYTFRSGDGPLDTQVSFRLLNGEMTQGHFSTGGTRGYNFSVRCNWADE